MRTPTSFERPLGTLEEEVGIVNRKHRKLHRSQEYARIVAENDMLRKRNLELDRQILEAENVKKLAWENQMLRERNRAMERALGVCQEGGEG